MSTITIKLRHATLHRIGPNHTARIECISGMHVPVGNADVLEIKPGQPFEIDRDEGLRLLKIHAGEIVGGAP
jgi:hypothetical protein